MRINSVNVGKAEPIGGQGTAKFYPGMSGINKTEVFGPVFIGTLGVEGDNVVNTKHHGGVDQAIYIYSREDYAYWEDRLGCEIRAGRFGENITVEGLESASVCVGDRFRFDKVLLEVTSPRIACSTFAAHMNDVKFPKEFSAAGRPGFYCRVLQEGVLECGQSGTIEQFAGEKVTMLELCENYPLKTFTEQTRKRYLSVPSHWKMIAYLNGERDKL